MTSMTKHFLCPGILLLLGMILCFQLVKADYSVTPLPEWVPDPGPAFLTELSENHPQTNQVQGTIYNNEDKLSTELIVLQQLPTKEQISSFSLGVNRDFFQVELHRFYLVRNGKKIDLMNKVPLKVRNYTEYVQGEVYDQEQKNSLRLPKLLAHDLLVVIWSTRGTQPDLADRLEFDYFLAESDPFLIEGCRIIVPREKEIFYKTFNHFPAPSTQTIRGKKVLSAFKLTPTEPQSTDKNSKLIRESFENRSSPSFEGYSSSPKLYVTDISSWDKLARTFIGWYEFPDSSADLLRNTANRITSGMKSETERSHALIRFVKEDIQYENYGLYKPRSPESVLRLGRGDCKSKVLLLKCLLEAEDIHSWPILVYSDGFSQDFRDFPTAQAFDHVIMAMDQQGQRRLIDVTTEFSSPISDSPGDFRSGLPLNPRMKKLGLTDLPPPEGQELTIIDLMSTPDSMGLSSIERTMEFGVYFAEENRIKVKDGGIDEVIEFWKNFGGDWWPRYDEQETWHYSSNKQLKIDIEQIPWRYYNQSNYHRDYKKKVFSHNEFRLPQPQASRWLTIPDSWQVKSDQLTSLLYPYTYNHEFYMPGASLATPDSISLQGPNVSFLVIAQQSGDTALVKLQLQTTDDHLEPKQKEAYQDFLDEWEDIKDKIRIIWEPTSSLQTPTKP